MLHDAAQPVSTAHLTRRDCIVRLTAGVAATLVGCSSGVDPVDIGSPRLSVRPHAPTTSMAPGAYPLSISSGRDGVLYVPDAYQSSQPTPLIVMLHGAGQSAADVTEMPHTTNQYGVILLVPESRSYTWDIGLGRFGPDIDFLDRAIDRTFANCNVRADRVALIGFSDGASYALTVGVANGDIFSHVGAFSPGYMLRTKPVGKPRVFVAHGTNDTVLPVAFSRDTLVPGLEADGYDVTYSEFDGGHAVYPAERTQALQWFTGSLT